MEKKQTAESQLATFWTDFNRVAEAVSFIGVEIYRGESKKYDVPSNPSLFRNVEDKKYGVNIPWQSIEEEMLSEFKRKAYSCFKDSQSIPNSQLEWRALAQHYGLPTRLIDWTTNPMVALYFAVEKYDEEDGALYFHRDIELVEYEIDEQIFFKNGEMYIGTDRYKPHQFTFLEDAPNMVNFVTEESLFHEPIIFYRPKYTDQRYSNQSTILGCPDGPQVDFQKLSREFVRIPAIIKPLLRKYLRKIGIDSSFIYPGLSGIAAQVDKSFTDDYLAVPMVQKYNMRTLFD